MMRASSQSRKNRNTKVEVRLPSNIKIELVQGNEFRHYEIFISLGSLALSTAVGFWTAYISGSPGSEQNLWSAVAFTILAVVSVFVAFHYRSKIHNGTVTKEMYLNKFD